MVYFFTFLDNLLSFGILESVSLDYGSILFNKIANSHSINITTAKSFVPKYLICGYM
jgi:hypothetical protein